VPAVQDKSKQIDDLKRKAQDRELQLKNEKKALEDTKKTAHAAQMASSR